MTMQQRVGSWALVSLIAIGVGGTAPAVAQTGSRLPWTATFDAGNLNEFNGFRNTTGSTVVDSGCFSGRCLRTPTVAGTESDNYGDFHFGDFYNVGGPKIEEVYLRLYSKFDAGGHIGNKIAIINLTDGVNNTKHYQVYIHTGHGGGYGVDHSYFSQWRFFALAQNQGTPVLPRPGQWDKLKLYVRLNTPGQSNGIIRFWVNDQLKLQYTNLNIRENTSYGLNKLNLSTYQPADRAVTNGVQWHDQFLLSTTDPDGGSTSTPPAAPTNLRIVTP
jgi:hypothetical protein